MAPASNFIGPYSKPGIRVNPMRASKPIAARAEDCLRSLLSDRVPQARYGRKRVNIAIGELPGSLAPPLLSKVVKISFADKSSFKNRYLKWI